MDDSQEMASEKEYLYAVVLFFPKKEKNNLIDLVPCSWIFTDEKGVFCCYPADEDYPKLPQWVASLRAPDKDWEHFDAEILAHARNIKQGQRRLKRAYKNLEVRSSDSENIPCNATPVVLSNNDLEKELDNMPMIISSIRSETVNSEPSFDQTMPTSCGDKTLTNGTEEDISALIGLDNMFISGHLKEYLDDKFRIVVATINSAKRSILYNVEKKTNELKLAIINSNTIAMPNDNINDIETKLEVVFPIRTIEDFLLFEEAIGTSEEKKKALIKWNQILIFGETCIKKCVQRIMTSTL